MNIKAKKLKNFVWLTLALVMIMPFFIITAGINKAEAREIIEGGPGTYDVVVYGSTSAGVTAAIAAKKEGANVILVSQDTHIGGLTSSGLGATDIANYKVAGGLARDFYQRIFDYYRNDPDAWVSETWDDYYKYVEEAEKRPIFGGKDDATEMMWVFEPKVAQKVFADMLIDEGIPVAYNERLNLADGVEKVDGVIKSVTSQRGNVYRAKVFIDASYEGDLMAGADVEYRVGREANSEYNETMNGILINNNEIFGVSPYIIPDDPDSGLLPYIEDKAPGVNGEADGRVQAYCFRFTLTTDPNNRMPITKPANYHPEWFEMRARRLMADPKIGNEFTFNRMPNNKTDTNHADFVGMSYEYADSDYMSRKNIEDDHRDYALNLMYFYANDPRVPKQIRDNMLNYGLPKDEFLNNDNFPVQIYLREGRRMVSDYVMKEGDVIQKDVFDETTGAVIVPKLTAPYSIGQGFYWFDSHRVSYFTGGEYEGLVATDGNFWSTRRDYPISYKSVVPKADQCSNLYVPVCLSSTHAAYGSIRMETTYMIIGESCGTAAAMSAAEMSKDQSFKVQDLDYGRLAVKLNANGQFLGDIATDSAYSKEQQKVLMLLIKGIVNADESDILNNAFTSAFNTPASVGLVKEVLFRSAKVFNKKVTYATTAQTLNQMGIIGNTAQWDSLFGETLPLSLAVSNVYGVLDKITIELNKSASSYIYDWLDLFRQHGVIDADTENYFIVNAASGKNPEVLKSGDLLYAIAQTISLDIGRESAATLLSSCVSMNPSTWQKVIDGTAASIPGSELKTIINRLYDYFKSNPDKLTDNLGVSYLNKLTAISIIDETDFINLGENAIVGGTVPNVLVKKIIMNSAKYINFNATESNALTLLFNKGVIANIDDFSGVMSGEDKDGVSIISFVKNMIDYIVLTPVANPLTAEQVNYFVGLNILAQSDAQAWVGLDRTKTIDSAKVKAIIERIGGRLSGTESALDRLQTAGIIDAQMKSDLSGVVDGTITGDFDGGIAANFFVAAHDYVLANNISLTAAQMDKLVGYGIIADGDRNAVESLATTFGDIEKAYAQKILENVGALINPDAADLDSKLDAAVRTGIIGNKTGWLEIFNSSAINYASGANTFIVVVNSVNFLDNTYTAFKYLDDNNLIDKTETISFWMLNGKDGNTVLNAKITALVLSYGKIVDSSVSTVQEAITALKGQNIITPSSDAWDIIAAADPAGESALLGLFTVTNRVYLYAKTNASTPIDSTILDWYGNVAPTLPPLKLIFGDGTDALSRAQIESGAREGVDMQNFTSSRNTAIRVLRIVTKNSGHTISNIMIGLAKTDFKFSDDVDENTRLTAYWSSIMSATDVANTKMAGGELKYLLERVYAYKNA